jgi:hypothetical protein
LLDAIQFTPSKAVLTAFDYEEIHYILDNMTLNSNSSIAHINEIAGSLFGYIVNAPLGAVVSKIDLPFGNMNVGATGRFAVTLKLGAATRVIYFDFEIIRSLVDAGYL